MSRLNLDVATERRVREVRKELHAIGFPGDDVDDEVLAGSLVLIRTDGWWEVVEGYRLVGIDQGVRWFDTTNFDDPEVTGHVVRTCTVRLLGNRPGVEAWRKGPNHIFAFDEQRFFLGWLTIDTIHVRSQHRRSWVDVEMTSLGPFQIDLWGNCPG